MRLGSETGSLVNHLRTHGIYPTLPAVGDGATVMHWTDRDAATVIEVTVSKSGKTAVVTVQGDHVKRVDTNGMSESQTYEYAPNPNGGKPSFKFRRVENGWKRVGKNGPGVGFGYRDAYHDYSF